MRTIQRFQRFGTVNPEVFLKTLRESDFFIEYIYTNGGYYQLYKILKIIFPEAKPYVKGFRGSPHVATLIGDALYDVNGLVDYLVDCDTTFFPMTEEQERIAETWSFAANNDLYLGECPQCECPITIDRNKLIGKYASRKYDL